MFAIALRNAHALSEERLLMVAEDLLAGEIHFAAAGPGESRRQHDYIMLGGVGTLQHPTQL